MLIVAEIAHPPPANAEPRADEIVNEDGDRIYTGEVGKRVEEINGILADPIFENPELFAGYSFTSDSQHLEVYAVNGEATEISALRSLVGPDFDEYVQVIEVPHSQRILDDARERAIDALQSEQMVTSVSTAPLDGTLRIGVAVNSGAAEESFEVLGGGGEESPISEDAQQLLRELSDSNGVEVEFREAPEAEALTNRHDDFAPFNMGGRSVPNTPGGCSLGWPVIYRGTEYVATAGHCSGTVFRNPNGNLIGNKGTTTWPGNASRYGDWMLIKGRGSNRIFTGSGMYSSSYSVISAAAYSPRATGSQLCATGATSNRQVCRFRVLGTGYSHRVDGVLVGMMVNTYHDGNLDGVADCSGMQSGDSGGPAYYANGNQPGTVVLNGMVQGRYLALNGRCRYTFTQLGGLRAWSTDAYVNR